MKEPIEDPQQYKKFYIEWWNIRKSTIYTIVFIIVLSVVGSGLYIAATRTSWFSGPVETDAPANSTRIISFEGDVRVTKASTRETIIVTRAIYVAAGDTIQTQADGKATLQMVDGSIYTVKPNSTVVVRDNSSLFGNKNVRVSLDDGQINVKTQQQGDSSQNVVEVAESENKLMPETDASFNADAQTNGGEIRITRGGVETTLGGETTVIRENEFASVNNGQISTREKLLDPPKQVGPANLTQIMDTTGTGGTVALSWQGNNATSYSLQVSRSPYFSPDSILVDRNQMTTNEFRLGGLSPGTYYWRVKSTAKSGQTTDWDEPWKFQVVKSDSGRSIDVADWHVENIGGNVYLITGRTQPGLSVRTQGREPTYSGSDGSFRIQVSTAAAVAPVEISDDRGNRTGFVLSLQTGKVMRKY